MHAQRSPRAWTAAPHSRSSSARATSRSSCRRAAAPETFAATWLSVTLVVVHSRGVLTSAARWQQGTILMALLQPPPEVYELFNDVLLLSEGAGVAPGLPSKAALPHSFRSLSTFPSFPISLPHTPRRSSFESDPGNRRASAPQLSLCPREQGRWCTRGRAPAWCPSSSRWASGARSARPSPTSCRRSTP